MVKMQVRGCDWVRRGYVSAVCAGAQPEAAVQARRGGAGQSAIE